MNFIEGEKIYILSDFSKSFADYKTEKYIWITSAKGQYYPDYLQDASILYQPVQEMFGQLVKSSASAEQFWDIQGVAIAANVAQ